MAIRHLDVEWSDWVIQAAELSGNGENSLVGMFANDERQEHGTFRVYALFSFPGDILVEIRVKVPEEKGRFYLESLTAVIPAAAWYEREIHDMFGIDFSGHPDLRPLVLHENWPSAAGYPMRKDFVQQEEKAETAKEVSMHGVSGDGVFQVPVGPIHAGIIEPGHFRFSQAGEPILRLDAKLFFTHRGIEKSLEGLDLTKALYRVERTCGVCAVSHALSFSQAVESMTEVEVPRRALLLRVLMAELERLYNHVGDIGNLCAGLGFAPGISHGARIKEGLLRLNEMLTGNRYLRGMVVPGGVRRDITNEFGREIVKAVYGAERDIREVMALLKDNEAFLNRVNTTGIVSQRAAKDLAVVGVAARASGIDEDVRKKHPYAVYGEMDFKIPVYSSGDVAARLWVREEEVFQSAALIRQVLDSLSEGPIHRQIPLMPSFTGSWGWSESARGSNFHYLMSDDKQQIFRYFIRSASYPNWPALTVAAPGNIIPDFPLINKSFELCYACLDR